jgi:hypothetical protein
MAWTQQDVTALKTAIASGHLLVRSGDRNIQYRSLAEMKETLRLMEAELDGVPTGVVIGRNRAAFRRD